MAELGLTTFHPAPEPVFSTTAPHNLITLKIAKGTRDYLKKTSAIIRMFKLEVRKNPPPVPLYMCVYMCMCVHKHAHTHICMTRKSGPNQEKETIW